MQLHIQKETPAEDVKKLFTANYPFLKIEFYRKPCVINELDKKASKPLSRFYNLPGNALIDIDKNITVAQLENNFLLLGLKAEIFRRCGNVWIETSLTDNWTLQQQNHEGEEITRHFSFLKTALSERI